MADFSNNSHFDPEKDLLAGMQISSDIVTERRVLRSQFSDLCDELGLDVAVGNGVAAEMVVPFLEPFIGARPIQRDFAPVFAQVDFGARNYRDTATLLYGDILSFRQSRFLVPTADMYSDDKEHRMRPPLMMPLSESVSHPAGIVFERQNGRSRARVLMTTEAFNEALERLDELAASIRSFDGVSQLATPSTIMTLLIHEAEWARTRRAERSGDGDHIPIPSEVIGVKRLSPPEHGLTFELSIVVMAPDATHYLPSREGEVVAASDGAILHEDHIIRVEKSRFGEVSATSVEFRARKAA